MTYHRLRNIPRWCYVALETNECDVVMTNYVDESRRSLVVACPFLFTGAHSAREIISVETYLFIICRMDGPYR